MLWLWRDRLGHRPRRRSRQSRGRLIGQRAACAVIARRRVPPLRGCLILERARLLQDHGDVRMATHDCQRQRRPAARIASLERGPSADQQLDGLARSMLRRHVQRRHQRIVQRIELRMTKQQQLDHAAVVVRGSHMQRRAARHPGVGIGRQQQQGQHPLQPTFGCRVHQQIAAAQRPAFAQHRQFIGRYRQLAEALAQRIDIERFGGLWFHGLPCV